jgi:hybrid cluster-associated redox disulfide protein
LRTHKDAACHSRDPLVVNTADVLNMLVSDVLAERPAAARVFVERRMACPGCAFAPFETVAEAAAAYGVNCQDLARSLAAATGAPQEVHR